MTEPKEVVDALKLTLRSKESVGLRFVSDSLQTFEIMKPLDRNDNKLSVRIATVIGRGRTERWPIDKLERYLEAGFLALPDGELIQRWKQATFGGELSPAVRSLTRLFMTNVDEVVPPAKAGM